jgi:hypothetical protein
MGRRMTNTAEGTTGAAGKALDARDQKTAKPQRGDDRDRRRTDGTERTIDRAEGMIDRVEGKTARGERKIDGAGGKTDGGEGTIDRAEGKTDGGARNTDGDGARVEIIQFKSARILHHRPCSGSKGEIEPSHGHRRP